MPLPRPLARLGRAALDAVLPPLCLNCQRVVAAPGTVCPECWSKITFIAPPFCARCGLPFEVDPGGDARCGACLDHPPRFGRALAVLRYDEHSRDLILRFKHGDRLDCAPGFAAWMARAGADLLDGAEMLVPVPLHRWRLARRRYNQAAVLALALAPLCGVPAAPALLTRRRATPSQGHLDPGARRRNVRGAFALNTAAIGRVAGRRVVLIDDVMTTGATLDECAAVLLDAGARAVDALTLARAIRA